MEPRYVRAGGVLHRRTLDRALVRRPDGPLHTLPGTAAEVWALLDRPRSVGELAAALAERYDATGPEIGAGVTALVERLLAAGVVVPAPLPGPAGG